MIEIDHLRPYAVSPVHTRGRQIPERESAHRSPHQRDRDRILHSTAFRRLMHKTQVFVAHEGDYYRTRLTHTLEVAQIARSAARSLRLNEDLTEAVALAHDLGHTPFGHAGEDALQEVMRDFGGFDHNSQALRIVTHLEQRYARFDGLNLTWDTLEGLVKHNGPLLASDATIGSLPYAIQEANALTDLELGSRASLEAQIAALADDIAYNCHDLEDGLRGGFFELGAISELPIFGIYVQKLKREFPNADEKRLLTEVLSAGMSDLFQDFLIQSSENLLIFDIKTVDDVRNSECNIVNFSEKTFNDLSIVSKFLFDNFYYSPYIVNQKKNNATILKKVFYYYLENPSSLPVDWFNKYSYCNDSQCRARLVCDYISGMTDLYILKKLRLLA